MSMQPPLSSDLTTQTTLSSDLSSSSEATKKRTADLPGSSSSQESFAAASKPPKAYIYGETKQGDQSQAMAICTIPNPQDPSSDRLTRRSRSRRQGDRTNFSVPSISRGKYATSDVVDSTWKYCSKNTPNYMIYSAENMQGVLPNHTHPCRFD